MKIDDPNYRWKRLNTQELFSTKYFKLRKDECEVPDGRKPTYFIVDFPDWVQVVALDKKQQLILVNQYRYPGDGLFLEFPGGTTNSDRKEDPLLAAQRELQEETGYTSSNWKYLGAHYPNPALMTNRCHVYLARDCEKTHELNLDPFEFLHTEIMSVTDYLRHLKDCGKIHSLMLATYALATDFL